MRIAICGAGIGGPTLAHWLLRAGHDVLLIEQAPRFRDGGYIVDFWGVGYDVAERMDILPRILTRGYQVREIRTVGAAGRRIAGFSADIFHRMTNDRFTSLPRGNLARAIYDRVEPKIDTRFGRTISSLADRGDDVELTLDSGEEQSVDLLIGADGLHSRVRALAFGLQAKFERRLGYHVAAFTVPGYAPRDPDIYVTRSWPGRSMARFALRDGASLLLFVFADDGLKNRTPDGPAEQRSALRAIFGGLDWEAAAALEAMAGVDEVYFDRVSQIEMPHWSKGRVALIGDAAACVSLLAGEGAGLAMTEAYVLAGELAAARGDRQAAFEAYERRLRGFIESKQKSARDFASSFAPRTRIGIVVRNLVMRLMGAPPIARLFLGNSLVDDFALPDYPFEDMPDR